MGEEIVSEALRFLQQTTFQIATIQLDHIEIGGRREIHNFRADRMKARNFLKEKKTSKNSKKRLSPTVP